MIPQCNPRGNFLAYRDEIERAIQGVLESGSYVLGRECQEFEKEFSHFIGVKNSVGVGSGTDAIELALRAIGVTPGDSVATVSHTAVATVSAIGRIGATPLFVDINNEFNLDPNHLEAVIKTSGAAKVKAVIAVHLYGNMADMPQILAVAGHYNIPVIEDCAQAHGAVFKEKNAGTWGSVGCFSFYPTKNLGALGDGGMVVTDDKGIAQRIMLLRQYGWETRYVSETEGYNSRLDEIQAAILRVKLCHLQRDNERRAQIASQYIQNLEGVSLALPHILPGSQPVYHQFVIQVKDRDDLKTRLAKEGIGTAIHYPLPIHRQNAYSCKTFSPLPLPVTESAVKKILSLPIFPELRLSDVEVICDKVKTILN